MDIELKNRLDAALEQVRKLTGQSLEANQLDPVQHLMLVALLNECQKIMDYADGIGERIAQHFAEDFIPRRSIAAMPAIAVVSVTTRMQSTSTQAVVGSKACFKTKADTKRYPGLSVMNFIPILRTLVIGHKELYLLASHWLNDDNEPNDMLTESRHQLYVGINTTATIDTLKGLSFLIHGTHGIAPERVYVANSEQQLSFATMDRLEDIEMLEPFDAQQSSGRFFSFVESWKEQLLEMDNDTLLYITEDTCDRDLFKPRAYPRAFQQWLEIEELERFDEHTLWLRLDFAPDYDVPRDCRVEINVLPVTNVDVNQVMLTSSQPIAKLQKQDGDYFLSVVESSTEAQSQGFDANEREFVIRDFDAACYNNGDLYREVRNLYNRFVDDYYAFIEYNGIKDGETIRTLRATINSLGKSVRTDNIRYRFDSGTYAMRNISHEDQANNSSTSSLVRFITTRGSAGNALLAGMTLESRDIPSLDRETRVLVGGMGGHDKATADQRYELLRYHTLTNDRLFTRMDIDAFLRKEIMAVFGRDEFKRIFIHLTVEGASGELGVVPGLYVDIKFKDRMNYDRAVSMSLGTLLEQRICRKSCLTMPITVSLINLEQ